MVAELALRNIETSVPAPRGVTIGRVVRWLVGMAVLCQIAQIFLFVEQLEAIRIGLAGISTALVLVATVLLGFEGNRVARLAIFIILAMAVSWLMAFVLNGTASKAQFVFQQLAFPAWMGATRQSLSERQFGFFTALFYLVIAYAAFVAFGSPSVEIGSVMRAAPFVETDKIHPSAYIVAGILLYLLNVPVGDGRLARLLKTGFILIALVLIAVYKVRTAQVMILTFLGVMAFGYARDRVGPILGWMIAIFTPLFAAFYLLFEDAKSLSKFSSGRTGVYQERLDAFAGRGIGEALFGTGAGSDFMASQIWWWATLNSHNDAIGIIMERGIFGIGTMVAALVLVVLRRNRRATACLLAIFTTGLISNGLFQRPTAAAFAFLAVAAADIMTERQEARRLAALT